MRSEAHHDLEITLELIDFRPAGVDEIDGLVDLHAAFFADSDLPELGLVFSRKKAREWLERVLFSHTPHVVAIEKQGGRLVGSLSYSLDETFVEKPYAYLDKFYVDRAWRLSGIGRLLLEMAMEEAKAEGAIAFRAGISSGIGYGKNLFLKHGFRETAGSTLLARRL